MNAPTANCFLLHFIQYSKCSKSIKHLARVRFFYCYVFKIENRYKLCFKYLCELSLLEGEPFLEFLPSQIATSSLYLSMLIINKTEWNSNEMCELTGYGLDDKIKSCANEIYKAMCNASASKFQAIRIKYGRAHFDRVSLIQPSKGLIF